MALFVLRALLVALSLQSASAAAAGSRPDVSALHRAAATNSLEAIYVAFQAAKDDVDKAGRGGATAMHVAAYKGHEHAVGALLELGARGGALPSPRMIAARAAGRAPRAVLRCGRRSAADFTTRLLQTCRTTRK